MFLKLKNRLRDILKWSEKYTGTDMIYLARGSFWLTSGQIISAGAVFATSLAFANLLPQQAYGTYKYILTLAGLFTAISLTGLSASLAQAAARGLEKTFQPIFKSKVRWSLIACIVTLSAGGYYFFKGNLILGGGLTIAGLFLPLMETAGLYSYLLQGRKNYQDTAKYQALSQIFASAVLITTLFLTHNLFIIIAAYFCSWTISRWIILKIILKTHPLIGEIDQQAVNYGKHLSLMEIINQVAEYLDKILIFQFLGAVQVAVYSIAIAVPEQIRGFIKNLNFFLLPKFATQDADLVQKNLTKKIILLIVGLIIIVALYILCAPFLFKLFFPKYLASITYSQFLALGLIAYASIVPLNFLKAHKFTKQLYQSNNFTSLFQIISLLILIKFFGIWGAVIAKVLTKFFNLIYLLIASKTAVKK